jgi:hypothetical protein
MGVWHIYVGKMKQIDIEIPTKLYEKFVEKYGGDKPATDLLSLKIEQTIKMERWLIRKRKPDLEDKTVVSVHIKEYLFPYLNEYCIHRKMSKKEMVAKLIKKLSK